jgi:hypothetical protein
MEDTQPAVLTTGQVTELYGQINKLITRCTELETSKKDAFDRIAYLESLDTHLIGTTLLKNEGKLELLSNQVATLIATP